MFVFRHGTEATDTCYDEEFGSATFDRTSTGSQGAEGPGGGVQVRGLLDVAILQA